MNPGESKKSAVFPQKEEFEGSKDLEVLITDAHGQAPKLEGMSTMMINVGGLEIPIFTADPDFIGKTRKIIGNAMFQYSTGTARRMDAFSEGLIPGSIIFNNDGKEEALPFYASATSMRKLTEIFS